MRVTILCLLTLAWFLYALDDVSIPNTFVPSTKAKSSEVNENFDSLRIPFNRLNDSLEVKFVRYADLNSGDSSFDKITVDTIRGNPDVDSISGNPVIDSISGNVVLDSISGNPVIDSINVGYAVIDTLYGNTVVDTMSIDTAEIPLLQTDTIFIDASSIDGTIRAINGNGIQIVDENNEGLWVAYGGNVGTKNQSSPDGDLHVYASDAQAMDILLGNSLSGNANTDGLKWTLNADGVNGSIGNNENGGVFEIFSNDDLKFSTDGITNQAMLIDSTGKVKIGSGSPTKELDVDGSFLVDTIIGDANGFVKIKADSSSGSDTVGIQYYAADEGTIDTLATISVDPFNYKIITNTNIVFDHGTSNNVVIDSTIVISKSLRISGGAIIDSIYENGATDSLIIRVTGGNEYAIPAR